MMHRRLLSCPIFILLFLASGAFAQESASLPPVVVPLPPLSASVKVKGLPAAPRAVPLRPGRRVFYDFASVQPTEDGPGVTRRTVIGESVLVSRVEYDARSDATLPGRTGEYERVILQLAGRTEVETGGRAVALDSMQLAIIPPRTGYAITHEPGPRRAVALEFTTAPRPDDGIAASRSHADPATVPAHRAAFMDFTRLTWTWRPNTVKYKIATGDSSTLMLWHLPASALHGIDRPGHHHTAEQISYVLRGHAQMRVGDRIREAGPGTLLMIPSNVDHLPMTPIDGEDIFLLDFQPIIRRDILTPAGMRKSGRYNR